MKKHVRKVLLIGWDGADWKIINNLISKGLMPSIQSLMQQGVHGNIATLDPPFSPMLWTTVATGMRPDKHGILGFIEPDTEKTAIRPVTSTSRKVKAIWNILNLKGYIPHVVGWWPSHPAEPINGIMISNHFQKVSEQHPDKIPKDCIHPNNLSNFFKHLRVRPGEITDQHLLPFVPQASKIDQEKDRRLTQIAKNIAECSSLHASATWILDNEDWDFLAIYLDTIDHFSHGFMHFHPPQMKGIKDQDFELYSNVINSAYMYHDMMLDTLLKLAGDDVTVMLLSDHGFHSDHLRPILLPDEPAGPAYEHRDYGILCIKGPGIKKGEKIHGASLLDITPTILHMYGLPVGKDMDGIPLVQAFQDQTEIMTIPSWEQIKGDAGMHPEGLSEDPFEAQESIMQLVELGYIEEPSEDNMKNIQDVIKETNYNLARVYMGAKKYEKAAPLLEELYKNEPQAGRFALRLIECYKSEGKIDACERILNEFKSAVKETIIKESEIKQIMNDKIPEDISKNEINKIKKERQKKLLNNKRVAKELLHADIIEGELATLRGNFEEALGIFQKIKPAVSNNPIINLKIGNSYLKMAQWEPAMNAFDDVLEIDPENDAAHHGKSIAFLRLGKYDYAIESALDSLNLIYNKPFVHYHLGEAFYKCGDYENAEKAFSVCLRMAPNIGKARNYLIDIYENHLHKNKNAEILKKYFKNKKTDLKKSEKEEEFLFKPKTNISRFKVAKDNNESIIIVSGLPRSGTSLMMQILDKAGMTLFTDNSRIPDDNNPKGFFEHEAVKRLARDNTWLKETKGKVVKIIAPLLFALPEKFIYKIIFMNRNIHEVILSQQKMLTSEGRAKEGTFSISLNNSFSNILKKVENWRERSHHVEILYIEHKELIKNPVIEINKVKQFLDFEVSAQELSKIIDRNLYRSKV
jgi:predicted AlkP superfamily phosphohydrolase/phosphomutase/tetratricopeptide (TPR) repeat protein